MTIFCERAKTRMKELHITTRQLAKSIGMTESTVSRYLSGNRSPKIEELVKIAETLECSADYLLAKKCSYIYVSESKNGKQYLDSLGGNCESGGYYVRGNFFFAS